MTLPLLMAFGIGYFFGGIPFGLIYGKLIANTDLRESGSGNIGATNALRAGGWKLGLLTLLSDGVKGIVAIAIVQTLYPDKAMIAGDLALVGAVLGHIFPVILGFRGGKGVATWVGGLLFLHPFMGGLLMGIWMSVFLLTRLSSLSALLALGTVLVGQGYTLVTKPMSREAFFTQVLLILVSLVILLKHHSNIVRLCKGQEKKISFPQSGR